MDGLCRSGNRSAWISILNAYSKEQKIQYFIAFELEFFLGRLNFQFNETKTNNIKVTWSENYSVFIDYSISEFRINSVFFAMGKFIS